MCSIYTQSVFSAVFLCQRIGKKAQQNRTVPACLFRDCLLSFFLSFHFHARSCRPTVPYHNGAFAFFFFFSSKKGQTSIKNFGALQDAERHACRHKNRRTEKGTEGHKPKGTDAERKRKPDSTEGMSCKGDIKAG